MKLNPHVHQFFDHYLPHIKGSSPSTVRAYRDAFRLFLPFAAKHYGIKIRSLTLEHLSSQLVLSFLDDLQKERKNLARTRNHRLAALKSFAKMIPCIPSTVNVQIRSSTSRRSAIRGD